MKEYHSKSHWQKLHAGAKLWHSWLRPIFSETAHQPLFVVRPTNTKNRFGPKSHCNDWTGSTTCGCYYLHDGGCTKVLLQQYPCVNWQVTVNGSTRHGRNFSEKCSECNHILLCGTCYPSGPKLTRQKRNLYTTVPVGRQILVLQCYGQFELRFSDVCHGLRRHSTHRKRAMHVHHEIHLSLIELFSVKKSASFGSRRHN